MLWFIPTTTAESIVPRNHFYTEEEKTKNRILVLKDLIADQEIQNVPCQLLATQLTQLSVLTKLLQIEIAELTKCVEKAIVDS